MSKFSKESLTADLLNLSVTQGDTLLVRADLGAIGKLSSKSREDYLECMLDAVGVDGTVVGLSFTLGSFIKKDKSIVFDGTNKSNTGAFANLMLSHEHAIRSYHPTNSYVAIGKHANYITKDHNESSGAYDPIRKIVELNGKMLLIGCAASSPGFTTTHLAETDIGLHKRFIAPWLNTAYYKKNDEIKLFKRSDLGGCSQTFYRLYGHYILHEKLIQGIVGNAYTLMIDAKSAYDIDLAVLKINPKLIICDDPLCLMCRARRWDNMKDLPGFVIRTLLNKINNSAKSH